MIDKPHLLYRNQSFPVIGVADTQLVGPNPKRWAVIVSAPVLPDQTFIPDGASVSGISTATATNKLTYTVPAGVNAVLKSATFLQVSGVAGVVSVLRVITRSVTATVAAFTNGGVYTGDIPLSAGDQVIWAVTGLVNPSTSDYTINVATDRTPTRVTLNTMGPAVLDQGINIYAGQSPFELLYDHVGQAIREEVRAIASVAGTQISVMDIFEP